MRTKLFFRIAFLGSIFATLSAQTISGQTADPGNWQVLRPAGEEFSILMPKDPVVETAKMPYHKMELNTRLYLSASTAGPTFAVVSLSGIKSNPAMYSDLERLNSYVDAFKKLFVPKVSPKAVATKFVLTGNKELNGHKGREYLVTIGDRKGTAYAFATRKRFYAVVFLTNQKADAVRDQFLASFELPPYVPRPVETVASKNEQTEQPASTVADEEQEKVDENERERQEAIANSTGKKGQVNPSKPEPNEPNPDTKTTDASGNTTPGQRAPISGGVLNGKALSLPPPVYPAEARAANISGSVTVQVLIDEFGGVISARAVSGPAILRPAAVAAAQFARFSPTTLMGEQVKVTGVLVYNFRTQ